jgi:hypothetical protein
VRLEGLGKLKKSPDPGFEPAIFRLVAQCLNQLRYRVPQLINSVVFSPLANYTDRAITAGQQASANISG